tara:strand:- start:151 stop:279 length:129 start_codon:yes stop_codon:yes gene_type:complete
MRHSRKSTKDQENTKLFFQFIKRRAFNKGRKYEKKRRKEKEK